MGLTVRRGPAVRALLLRVGLAVRIRPEARLRPAV